MKTQLIRIYLHNILHKEPKYFRKMREKKCLHEVYGEILQRHIWELTCDPSEAEFEYKFASAGSGTDLVTAEIHTDVVLTRG
jgi:hypothetical protein